jgi:hypothetical protein
MNFIQEFESLLSAKECGLIISDYLAESEFIEKRSDANLHGVVKEWGIPKEGKWMSLYNSIEDRLNPFVEQYLSYSPLLNSQSYYFKHLSIMEHKEEFNIPYHYDAEVAYMNEKEYIRNFAFLIYLNDGFENGELIFPVQKRSIRPKVGLGVIFPTSFMYPHLTNSAIGENRYVLRVAYYFKKESIINSVKESRDYY